MSSDTIRCKWYKQWELPVSLRETSAVFATNRGGTLIQHCMAPTMYLTTCHMCIPETQPAYAIVFVSRYISRPTRTSKPRASCSSPGRHTCCEEGSGSGFVQNRLPSWPCPGKGQSEIRLQGLRETESTPLTLVYLYPVRLSGALPFSTQSTIRNKTLFCAVCSVPLSSAAFCPIPQAPTPPEQ
jgi:hypothetical protein